MPEYKDAWCPREGDIPEGYYLDEDFITCRELVERGEAVAVEVDGEFIGYRLVCE